MSHFTVMVVAKDEEELASRLAPFQENNMGDCPEEFLEFNDVTDEYRAEAQKVVTEEDTWMLENHKGCLGKTYQEVYGGTFESFMSEYAGYEPNGPNGEYGYWENPNKKWDWWEVGGRWSGAVLGNGLNSCLVSEFDIEALKAKQRKNAGEKYDRVMHILKSMGLNEEEIRIYVFGKTREEKQPVWDKLKEPNAFEKLDGEDNILIQMGYDLYDEDREKHVTIGEHRPPTFAYLHKDGTWFEKGNMGWWACVTNEDLDAYTGAFWVKFAELEPDDRLWIVDCHI